MTETNTAAADANLAREAEAERQDAAAWARFDKATRQRALTLPELRDKLELLRWALDRGCPEQAATMAAFCIDDLAGAR